MAWIESHQSLGAHPKTKRLARLLNAPLPQVVGHLHMLWWWAFDYAQDGDLSRYAPEDIADAVLWEGSASLLMAALLDAGFLDQPDGKPCIHDWNEYGGKLLVRRRADAGRKGSARNPERVQRTSNGHPTDIQRTAHVEDIEDIEESRSRECAPTAAADFGPEPSEADQAVGRLCRSWENATNTTVTRSLGDHLADWLEKLPEAAIVKGIAETGASNARNWRYCEAILRRYQTEGWADKPKGPEPYREPPPPTADQVEEWIRNRPERFGVPGAAQ